MRKRKKLTKKPAKPLDTLSEKRDRGRPRRMRASEVLGRSENFRYIFDQVWDRLSGPLLQAKSEAEVNQALQTYAVPYEQNFVPHLVLLIFGVVHDPKFPKRRETQIRYLADSIAALGTVTARRSREIVVEEIAKQRARQRHKILRKEFYIECSCGYAGATYKRKCPMSDPERAKIENHKIIFGNHGL